MAVGAGWLALLVFLVLWLQTPTPELREQLKSWQFWSLEVCLALSLTLGGLAVGALCRALQRGDVGRLTILAAAALVLTVLVAPRTNRIYYDEHIYQGIAHNLSDARLAQMCNDGIVEYGRLQCWIGEYNKQPYAYPHVLSVLYRAFGVSKWTAFAFNAVVMPLTACGIYLLVLTLFADRTAALLSGLIVVLIPHQVLWSATAAVEPSASLACILALLCAASYRQSGSTLALAATAATTVYAVQFRPESLLIVPIVGLLLSQSLAPDELRRPKVWAVGLFALALAAVHIGHMAAVRNEGWGANDARLSLGYVMPNLRVNGGFYIADGRFPMVVTILALVGVLGRSFRSERRVIGLYFLAFFAIYLLFYAGSYNYGADVRYSLMTYPPIAILGGLGASTIARWIERVRPAFPGTRAVTIVIVAQFLLYAPVMRATTEEAWAARADVRFAESLVPELRGNSYVLTHNPGMFHLWGVNAGQMSLLVTNQRSVEMLAPRYAGGVFLHWNFWCNVDDPTQQMFCRQAIEGKALEPVREYRERDQRFALYRFAPTPARALVLGDRPMLDLRAER